MNTITLQGVYLELLNDIAFIVESTKSDSVKLDAITSLLVTNDLLDVQIGSNGYWG